eukprot:TRINITY_DN40327_c0_g1_i1.p1 TRINITY_DN40327_c0_g1~~TRINITY_DN40327_c0_g1_i1.p1  ORF type:complete len:334 (+),score=95.49 TRINITY_DN40327_c0_g1_i1:50-1003(+)
MGKKKEKLAAKAKKEQETAEAAEAAPKRRKLAEDGASAPIAASEAKQSAPAAAAAPAKGAEAPVQQAAPEGEAHAENVFRAATVIFFTRDKAGAVSKVLVGLEERKVSAAQLGLDEKGKVSRRMAVFPMGRREKKDKTDSVETAKREYIEETGDFGALAQYLDFADFECEDDGENDGAAAVGRGRPFTGKHNLAIFFKPASMICLFCEVPAKAAERTNRAAENGVQLGPDGEPLNKKLKKGEALPKPSPSYHVGKTDHMDCGWLDAATLREALSTGDKVPELQVGEERRPLFPLAASVLRMPEARSWLYETPKPTSK